MKPSSITVTGQEIDLSSLSEKQYAYYIQLAEKINALYSEAKEHRVIIGLSGPAGAGKSVITEILTHIFSEKNTAFEYINVGLDAFHYTNAKLEEKGLQEVKGRYDTYDVALLTEKLSAFKEGKDVSLPVYSRAIHNPVPDALKVTEQNALILLEGQWLLRNTPEWERVRSLCTHQFSVTGPEQTLKENVIKRHIAGGRGNSEAEAFYNSSDLVNTKEIHNNSVDADETLLFYKDI